MAEETFESVISPAPEPSAPATDGEGAQESAEQAPDESTETASGDAEGTETTEDGEGSEHSDGIEDTPEYKEIFERFAKRLGVDPNDPAQAKTLKTLAHQELTIQRYKAGQTEGQPQGDSDDLTEFEKLAQEDDEAETQPEAAQPTGQPQQARPAEPGKYGDIGDDWKSEHDYLNAYEKAYAIEDPVKRHEAVASIENAAFARRADYRFNAVYGPQIQALFSKMFADQFGGVLPHVQQSVRESRRATNQREAIAQLSHVKGYEGIADLLKESEGDLITYRGEKFANTPFNRIATEFEEVLKINVSPSDPEVQKIARKTGRSAEDVAEQMTVMGQLRAVEKIRRTQQIKPTQAKQLVQAGVASAQREQEQTNRVRQSLNSGKPASQTTPSGNWSPGQNEQTLEDLFKGKY